MTPIHDLPALEPKTFEPKLASGQAVKIIGLGGVGGIFCRYGCLFLASLRTPARAVLIDGDTFDPTTNTSRMFFATAGHKAEVVLDELRPFFAESQLALSAIPEYVTPENIGRLIHDGDIVVLCVDNHRTRSIVNEHCEGLDNICLLSGGNDGVGEDSSGTYRRGTCGGVQIYVRRDGVDLCNSLSRFHPEIANPVDTLPSEKSCVELQMSTPQILPANVQTASALLNALWLYVCRRLHYAELGFDIADGRMGPLPIGNGPHVG